MEPLDILIDEHGIIRQFLENLVLSLKKMEQGERPPKKFFEKAVSFAGILPTNTITLKKSIFSSTAWP